MHKERRSHEESALSSVKSLFLFAFVDDRRLSRGKAGKRDTERRAGNVVESNRIIEHDGGGIATGFAADTDEEVRTSRTATLNGDLDEFANAIDIDGLERVKFVDLALDVSREELRDVVTGEAHGELGEVVGAEGEELRIFGKVASTEGATRDFDHGADVIDELLALFGKFVFDSGDDGLLGPEVFLGFASERDHDFWLNFVAKFLAGLDGSLDDGAGEHGVDLWVSNAETDTTEAHHWVGLVELFDSLFDLLLGDTELFGDVFDVGFVVGFW